MPTVFGATKKAYLIQRNPLARKIIPATKHMNDLSIGEITETVSEGLRTNVAENQITHILLITSRQEIYF